MLQGSFPALITPFKGGEIDYNSLERLLHFHLENGSHGLVLLGTTAETPALAGDEKESLLRFCVQRLKGKLPIVAGTGTNNFMQTVSATHKAADLGVEYALVVTPYYNKPNQDGLYLYYSELVKKTSLPIIIYNVPGRTGCNIATETVIRLANEFPERIVAIKEASGDFVKAGRIIRDTPATFSLVSGEDALNYPLMCIGAKGAISVTANAVPKQMSQLIANCLAGKYDQALRQHQQLIELNEVMFIDTNPIPVKVAVSHIGLCNLEYRLPMCQTTEEKKSKIISIYERFTANSALK